MGPGLAPPPRTRPPTGTVGRGEQSWSPKPPPWGSEEASRGEAGPPPQQEPGPPPAAVTRGCRHPEKVSYDRFSGKLRSFITYTKAPHFLQ